MVNPSTSDEIVGEDIREGKSPELDSAQGILAEKDQVKETPIADPKDETSTNEKAKTAGIEIGKKNTFTRGVKVQNLLKYLRSTNNYSKKTLSGCIIQKIENSVVISKEKS